MSACAAAGILDVHPGKACLGALTFTGSMRKCAGSGGPDREWRLSSSEKIKLAQNGIKVGLIQLSFQHSASQLALSPQNCVASRYTFPC